MNILTSLILSTKKQAVCYIPLEEGRHVIYKCVVTSVIPDKMYTFEVFHIIYPDKQSGKGFGEPCISGESHFSKRLSLEDLLEFLQIYFDELQWLPVEQS